MTNNHTFELNGRCYTTDQATIEALRSVVPGAEISGDSSAVQAVLELGLATRRIREQVASTDLLIASLTLPDVEGSITCAVHGSGGLYQFRDFDRLARRVEWANSDEARCSPQERDATATIYLAWQAHGCIAATVSLRGAKVAPANPVQRECFRVRSQLHRQTADAQRNAVAGEGLLELEAALDLARRLPKMVREVA